MLKNRLTKLTSNWIFYLWLLRGMGPYPGRKPANSLVCVQTEIFHSAGAVHVWPTAPVQGPGGELVESASQTEFTPVASVHQEMNGPWFYMGIREEVVEPVNNGVSSVWLALYAIIMTASWIALCGCPLSCCHRHWSLSLCLLRELEPPVTVPGRWQMDPNRLLSGSDLCWWSLVCHLLVGCQISESVCKMNGALSLRASLYFT